MSSGLGLTRLFGVFFCLLLNFGGNLPTVGVKFVAFFKLLNKTLLLPIYLCKIFSHEVQIQELHFDIILLV